VVTILYAYTTYSTFYVFGMSNRTVKNVARFAVATFCVYMLYCVITLCKRNVKGLYRSYLGVDSINQSDIKIQYIKKIILYSVFCAIVIIHYLIHIAKEIYCLLVPLSNRKEYTLLGLEAMECWVLYLIVVCLFHPCLFIRNFGMAIIYKRNVRCV